MEAFILWVPKITITFICLDIYSLCRVHASYWPGIYQAYVGYPSIIMNNIAFYSQNCAGWDDKSYGPPTYGRVHPSFSCPTPAPLEFWVLHCAQAYFYEGTALNHCILEPTPERKDTFLVGTATTNQFSKFKSILSSWTSNEH